MYEYEKIQIDTLEELLTQIENIDTEHIRGYIKDQIAIIKDQMDHPSFF
mgnify:CR=1 FL=1